MTAFRPFDAIIRNTHAFDGRGAELPAAHVGIRDGVVAAFGAEPLDETGCPRVIDGEGRWLMPGFIDNHTHYDAEVLVAPGLTESVRHGITTVVMGSCSLSTIHVDALDAADLFSRVEALPRDQVLSALEEQKSWTDAAGYIDHLESLPLGPNVACYLGHSDLRTHVMGLGRAVDPAERPTEAELQRMETLLDDALDAGCLGMSTMTNPWDKLDGDRYRSKQLPSTYAHWSEYRRLHERLRARDRILQSAPNITTKVNVFAFIAESAGFGLRKPLRTTLITAADTKADPWLSSVLLKGIRLLNRVLNADVRFQSLPVPFEVYADGIDLVVFEEFGAGEAALHLKDEVARNALLEDEGYRRRFRRDYEKRFTPRVWNRDFFDSTIVECPDPSLVGLSFGAVAERRGLHPVDAFLDLVVEHGPSVRWTTVIANHRVPQLREIAASPVVQIGFSDAGAHLRNMAFYNFPLRLLKLVQDAADEPEPFMTIPQAVARVTGELADWYGLDAGHLEVGARADLVLVDPSALDASLAEYHEAVVPELGGVSRMVKRNDAAVCATFIGGEYVFGDGHFVTGYGRARRYGRFLGASEASREPVPAHVVQEEDAKRPDRSVA